MGHSQLKFVVSYNNYGKVLEFRFSDRLNRYSKDCQNITCLRTLFFILQKLVKRLEFVRAVTLGVVGWLCSTPMTIHGWLTRFED